MKYFLSLICCLTILTASAGKKTEQKTYNFLRGMEAVDENDSDNAVKFLKREIEENPKHGEAYVGLALAELWNEEYRDAIDYANKALRYLDKNDNENISVAYRVLGCVNKELERYDEALEFLDKAITYDSSSEENFQQRGFLYIVIDKIDLAIADFQKAYNINPADYRYPQLLAFIYFMNDEYDNALDMIEREMKIGSDSDVPSSLRPRIYMKKGEYGKVIDEAFNLVDKDDEETALKLLNEAADSAFNVVDTRLRLRAEADPDNGSWVLIRARVNDDHGKYDTAIKLYNELLDKDYIREYVYAAISDCYQNLGAHEKALEYIDMVLEDDPDDFSSMLRKSLILMLLERFNEATDILSQCIKENPEMALLYNIRGYIYRLTGDYQKGIDDLTISTILDSSDIGTYLGRGILYQLSGDESMALADFNKIINEDPEGKQNYETAVALVLLGQTDDAVKAIETYIENNQDIEDDDYYDLACVYARLNNADKAVEYLRKSFESDNVNNWLIKIDTDLDNIRQNPVYIQFIEELKAKSDEMLKNLED